MEDEQPLLEAIKAKLEKGGFDVLTARSVEQAKNHVKDVENIDVIWLDHYLLGDENGLDFVAWCKMDGSTCKQVPIFVVSNTATDDKIKTYLHLGAEKYYVKAEKRLEDVIDDINKHLTDTDRK